MSAGGSAGVLGAPVGGAPSGGASGMSLGGAAGGGGNNITSGGGLTVGGSHPTGGSSAAGTGGTEVTGHPGPPYLFPQNNRSANCTYPSAAQSQDARTAYTTWKAKLVTGDGAGGYQRVLRPDNENNTTNTSVSEGIGYGMILAVVMDDPTLFDNLWNYSQIHLNANRLMIWLIDASGNPGVEDSTTSPPTLASGSATDADEDTAWALAMAAQKWGGHGSLTTDYLVLAKAQITRIWNSEVDHSGVDLINAGDSWGTTFAWNPSYFAPNEYRLFAKLDTANTAAWTRIIDKGYAVLAASQNTSTGLFPAWTNASGTPNPPWTGAPTNYQYDAARVPFRIGLDYCDSGDSRAKNILAKTSIFFAGLGASGIVDGYSLTGTPTPENTTPVGVQSALFVGAAGVGAMSDATYQPFVNAVYTRLVTQPDSLMLPKSYYFNLSWKVFSLLMMSGNLFDYTLHP
jgi:endo-1,4-beta-D-glucanase Y